MVYTGRILSTECPDPPCPLTRARQHLLQARIDIWPSFQHDLLGKRHRQRRTHSSALFWTRQSLAYSLSVTKSAKFSTDWRNDRLPRLVLSNVHAFVFC